MVGDVFGEVGIVGGDDQGLVVIGLQPGSAGGQAIVGVPRPAGSRGYCS